MFKASIGLKRLLRSQPFIGYTLEIWEWAHVGFRDCRATAATCWVELTPYAHKHRSWATCTHV